MKWFWILAAFIGGWVSLFASVASVIHFEILAALGFLPLGAVCFGIHAILLER
jgi:hypothetical protein